MTDLIGSFGPVFIASAAVFGPLSGWLAGRRDRHPVVWFVFGAVLGPIAVLLLFAAPPGRCWMCDTPVRGWVSICAACGAPLTSAAGAGRYQGTERWPARAAAAGARAALRSTAGAPNVGMPTPPVLTMLRSQGAEPSPEPLPSRETVPAREAFTGREAFASREAVPSPEVVPSPPIVLPIGRPARPRRPELPDRAAGAPRRSSPEHDAGTAEVLATGVYFGGTAGLAVGARYVIVRHDPVLRLLGPVDLDPTRVALERPLARLVAVSVGERLIITEGNGARVAMALGLGALAGMTGPQLELALTAPDPSTADRRPASG